MAEIDAAAVVQQQLQAPQGLAVGLVAAPVALLGAAQGQAVDPFAADQAHAGADRVFLEHQTSADVVEEQLLRPHPKGAVAPAGAVVLKPGLGDLGERSATIQHLLALLAWVKVRRDPCQR